MKIMNWLKSNRWLIIQIFALIISVYIIWYIWSIPVSTSTTTTATSSASSASNSSIGYSQQSQPSLNSSDKRAVIKYYSLPTCPPCLRFTPIFDAWIKTSGAQKIFNLSKIADNRYNCGDSVNAKQCGALGKFPSVTITETTGTSEYRFDGPYTKEGLELLELKYSSL